VILARKSIIVKHYFVLVPHSHEKTLLKINLDKLFLIWYNLFNNRKNKFKLKGGEKMSYTLYVDGEKYVSGLAFVRTLEVQEQEGYAGEIGKKLFLHLVEDGHKVIKQFGDGTKELIKPAKSAKKEKKAVEPKKAPEKKPAKAKKGKKPAKVEEKVEEEKVEEEEPSPKPKKKAKGKSKKTPAKKLAKVEEKIEEEEEEEEVIEEVPSAESDDTEAGPLDDVDLSDLDLDDDIV